MQTMTGITQIGAEAASESNQGSNGDYDDDEWYDSRYDIGGLPWANTHPTTAVRGTAKALRFFGTEEENYQRGYFGVVLQDPSVYTGEESLENTVIYQSTEDGGDDFKVVNADDEQTETEKIETGVDFAGNLFYGEEVDEFGVEELVFKASGSAGRSIATTLDVKGAGGAHAMGAYDDEDVELHDGGFPKHSGNLIEYHPDGRDGEQPRVARDTELRPDVEDREVIIMIQRLAEIDEDYDGPAYWATVFAESEDTEGAIDVDGTSFVQLEPTDEFEPSEDNLRTTGFISWNRPDVEAMNQARLDADQDVYVPEDATVEEVVGDDVDVESVSVTGPGVEEASG
jgi:hypothetical protein